MRLLHPGLSCARPPSSSRADGRSDCDCQGARWPPLPLHRLRPHHGRDSNGRRGTATGGKLPASRGAMTTSAAVRTRAESRFAAQRERPGKRDGHGTASDTPSRVRAASNRCLAQRRSWRHARSDMLHGAMVPPRIRGRRSEDSHGRAAAMPGVVRVSPRPSTGFAVRASRSGSADLRRGRGDDCCVPTSSMVVADTQFHAARRQSSQGRLRDLRAVTDPFEALKQARR